MTASWEFYGADNQIVAICFSAAVAFYLYMTLTNDGTYVRVKENKPY